MKLRPILAAGAAVALMAAVALAAMPSVALAQEGGGGAMGSGGGSSEGMNPAQPAIDASMPPPIEQMHIRQPVTGSMLAAPPYGFAPMSVGFFVLADDPEGIGFLTYSWNFGDGTVSALPPELYIFHTYKKPGNYLCSLTVKTVDGRSKIFMQGVLVKQRGG
jgi:PKD domain